eukprot:17154-Chlamydomonas_euryale.AAC.2
MPLPHMPFPLPTHAAATHAVPAATHAAATHAAATHAAQPVTWSLPQNPPLPTPPPSSPPPFPPRFSAEQVADRAMALLAELQAARRSAARNLDDARRALESAHLEAQQAYGTRLDELSNALLTQQTNARAMRADMQRVALDALVEVRREMLNRVRRARGHAAVAAAAAAALHAVGC